MKKKESPLQGERPIGRVAFSTSPVVSGLPNDVVVLYVPAGTEWNDFGFRTHARVGIREPGGKFEWVSGRIAFRAEKNSRNFVDELVRNKQKKFVYASSVKRPHATILSGIAGYKALVNTLGVEGARNAAEEANDVCYLSSKLAWPTGWGDFFSSDVFSLAFMRMSETAFAFDNASAILDGADMAASDAKQDIEAVVKLGRTRLNFHFRFPSLKLSPSRIAAIIGKNGVGKTHALSLLSKALVRPNNKAVKFSNTPKINRVLAFVNSRAKRKFVSREAISASAAEIVFPLEPGLAKAQKIEMTGLIARTARDASGIADSLTMFVKVLHKEVSDLDILVPVIVDGGDDSRSDEYVLVSELLRGLEGARLRAAAHIDIRKPVKINGRKNKERKLSLGQEVFVLFLLRVLANSGPASVLLIDEPENFLHPNLISQFIRVVNEILEQSSSIALIATHSPFVVRDLASSQIHVIEDSTEALSGSVSSPRNQTFGASISSISDDIFRDDMIGHLYQETIQRMTAQGTKSLSDDFESFREELSLDAYLLVRKVHEEGI